MTAKVAILSIPAGIQRDGTLFSAPSYIDGEWCRFQYGRPRKMGGYSASFVNAPGISRGMILQSQDGHTWVISGFSDSIQQWTIDNDDAVGSGPSAILPVGSVTGVSIVTQGSGYVNGTYTNVPLVTVTGTGALATVTVSSNQVFSVVVTNGGTATYPYGESFTINNTSIGGSGSGFAGVITANSAFTPNDLNLWQFDTGYDPYGTGNNNVIAHPGLNLQHIDNTTNTRPLIGPFTGNTLTPVGVFSQSGTTTNMSKNVTFTTTNVAIGAGVSVTGAGIPANTVVVSANLVSNSITLANVSVTGTAGQFSCNTTTLFLNQKVVVSGTLTGTATGISAGNYYIIATNGTTTFTLSQTSGGTAISTTAGTTAGLTFIAEQSGVWTATLNNAATASATVTLTFDNNISVSGGIVMLYPYLFVYGNNGLIQNCAAGNFNDWTSADSNANNVASTKVIKGLPLRGGTTSPSGLFWTLDSVVRVTYAPQNVGTSTLYWRYDLITQQSSIMSSSCVIEYDGIYYWVGVDRFLMYNGVVQEVPNSQNLNWFFDGINTSQRQKVWVSKIPRWGEIWWFYPRGDATECTDAIVFNVRDKVWYDAGSAPGARRSAGTFSEVYKKPIWAANTENDTGQYDLWVHEQGTNEVYLNKVVAVYSAFETNVLGTSAGLVGSPQGGDNLWTRLERVEPDFQQVGAMDMIVTGKGYADDTDQPSAPYTFEPSTLKIDLKEQRREMRLRFESNTQDGNYFLGRVVLNVETGDVRGTGNP